MHFLMDKGHVARFRMQAIKVDKGMDFNFMREYISKHDNAEQLTADFEKLCNNQLSYGEIKSWFLAHYPVFNDCKTRADWILAAYGL